MQSEAWGASVASEASGWEFSISSFANQGQRTEAGDQCHMVARFWAIISDTLEDLCFLHPSTRNCRGIQIMVITRVSFFGRNCLNRLETCIFPSLRTQQVDDHSTQLIEVDGWSNHWKIRNGDQSVSGGTGPLDLHILPTPVLPIVWGCLGPILAQFFQDLVFLLFSRVFSSFERTHFWKHDDVFIPLGPPFPHKAATTYLMNDPCTIHWFPLISHDVAQLDLPCHQFVVLTHLRLRQWRCNKLCWCPACKEAVVSGKWFAHWQCILCWQNPAAFTVWWINPVDRLTCHRCDTLRNNILKQLLYSQPDITWNWFPSTLGEVQHLS